MNDQIHSDIVECSCLTDFLKELQCATLTVDLKGFKHIASGSADS